MNLYLAGFVRRKLGVAGEGLHQVVDAVSVKAGE